MAWQTIRFKLTSSCPLMLHNGQTADPLNKWAKLMKLTSGKRAKTDADYEELARLEFLAALYLDKDGPVIPSTCLDAMLYAAAKKSREGTMMRAGVFALKHARLEYDGPRQPDELWKDERFVNKALVRVQTSRIVRTRPIFPEWSAMVELQVEDTVVNPARVDDWMNTAGMQVGLCERRPIYGRFVAERLD